MKFGAWSFIDMFRILFTLLITVLVAFFIAPIAPWILWLAVFANFYIVSLELVKYYLGIKEMRSKKQKPLVIREPTFEV